MARPPVKIDAKQVEKLAAIGCSQAEIGQVVGCSRHTLERRFATALTKGLRADESQFAKSPI